MQSVIYETKLNIVFLKFVLFERRHLATITSKLMPSIVLLPQLSISSYKSTAIAKNLENNQIVYLGRFLTLLEL